MKYVLSHQQARTRAMAAIAQAPDGFCVTIKEPTRSLEANAKLWALLHDVAGQIQWPVDGVLQYLPEESWKDIFTAALKRHQRMAKGIDGGFVMIGGNTSSMTRREMSDLIELIQAFGAEHNVRFNAYDKSGIS